MRLDPHVLDLSYCTFCPKMCRAMCPVTDVEARESVTPGALMNLAWFVQAGAVQIDADVAEIAYHCTGCLGCREFCLHGIDVPLKLFALRAEAVDAGVAPSAVGALRQRWLHTRCPAGERLDQRLAAFTPGGTALAPGLPVIFAGCAVLTDRPSTLRAVLEVAAATGARCGLHTGERLCCGGELLWAGLEDLFVQNAQVLAADLSRYDEIVVLDPACAVVLRDDFPRFGAPITAKITTAAEWLRPFVEARPPATPPAATAFDSCHGARATGSVAASRAVVHAHDVGPFVGERTRCCGGAGGLPLVAPEVATDLAHEELARAAVMATDSPRCAAHLCSCGGDVTTWIELLAEAYRQG